MMFQAPKQEVQQQKQPQQQVNRTLTLQDSRQEQKYQTLKQAIEGLVKKGDLSSQDA